MELCAGKGEKIPAEGLNISESGVLIRTGQELDTDIEWVVKFSAGLNHIQCSGKVVYCYEYEGGYRSGVEFHDLNEDHIKKLNHYLLQLANK